ncbi:hypothetical protein, variant 3 [Aphanomyces invadans]|uniref:Uncharacterized protein n=1 Tax=Aphanomyces invadans TaxID=157072 RepID=A0A024TM36_9STRA|nr:hypothetical protein, variant 2 [Aphanomyces invadans]XP_008875921.1 hypothetical protein, variant 3 [Aphanomyces invadans]ETV95219.1 hypothetical protein, variant 2 [Aphanomyces invadans]ETV95220.1 hypothetical protein, variant 3 [Aphanomyces invadans]|eukprot:XP_008875920.1 hypothetical protein, variant 2 [Aphanomyces invadans]
MAKASQVEDSDSSVMNTRVNEQELIELPWSRLPSLVRALAKPSDDTVNDVRDQEELISVLSKAASTSSTVDHQVLQCITTLIMRAKRDFARDTLHEPQEHFMHQSFLTSCSYLYAHAASISALPRMCPEVEELRRSFQILFSFQPSVRSHDGVIDLNRLVTVWKNVTKLCKTFSSFIATPENASGISKLLMHVEFTILDTMSFIDRCQLSASVDSTTIAHNIQGARVLFKALQGLLHTFANVLPQQEIDHYWECMGQCLGVMFCHRTLSHVDASCQKHWSCLIDDTTNVIKTSFSFGGPSKRSFATAFEMSFLDLVDSNASFPPERVLHLLVVYSWFSVDTDHDNRGVQLFRHVAAFDGIVKALSALNDNVTLAMTLVEPTLRLYFDAYQRGSTELQTRLLQLTFKDQSGHRHLCRRLWIQALCLWNTYNEACGDEIIHLLLDLTCSNNENFVKAHRIVLSDLLVDMYPAMTLAQKTLCINRCTTVVENMCADGPSYDFSLAAEATLTLLERLTVVGNFIDGVDVLWRSTFVENFLAMSFECCGTAVNIIEQACEENSPVDKGIWRIVDATLLILRTIFSSTQFNVLAPDDQEEVEGYIAQTMPMLVEVLRRLSKTTSEACDIQRRIVQSIKYLLTTFHPGLRRNQDNHLILVLEAMLRMSNIPALKMHSALLLKWLANIQVPPCTVEAVVFLSWSHVLISSSRGKFGCSIANSSTFYCRPRTGPSLALHWKPCGLCCPNPACQSNPKTSHKISIRNTLRWYCNTSTWYTRKKCLVTTSESGVKRKCNWTASGHNAPRSSDSA